MARKGENIFKRKDGRWEARYIKGHRDGRAVYGYVYADTYANARQKKADAVASLDEEKLLSGQEALASPLFRQVGDQWMAELSQTRKESTLVKYDNQLQKHIYPALGSMRIDRITNRDITAFAGTLLSETDGKGLAPKTAADIVSRVKSIGRYAILQGYGVCYSTDCVTIPQRTEQIRVFSRQEEKRLYRYLQEHEDLDGLGVQLCLFTGIRIGELCALKWSDFSLPEKKVHICRTMQRLKNRKGKGAGKTYIDIGEPKSACSIRTIPLPEHIMGVLEASYREDAYVLTGQRTRYTEPRTMEYRFCRMLRDCGIEKAGFHTLRHTFATRCVEVGFDIKSLSEILGHANVNITLNRYVHPSMDLKRDNMDKLAALFAVK